MYVYKKREVRKIFSGVRARRRPPSLPPRRETPGKSKVFRRFCALQKCPTVLPSVSKVPNRASGPGTEGRWAGLEGLGRFGGGWAGLGGDVLMKSFLLNSVLVKGPIQTCPTPPNLPNPSKPAQRHSVPGTEWIPSWMEFRPPGRKFRPLAAPPDPVGFITARAETITLLYI